ncbi:MAG TPA: hypothetical protein VEX69_03850 [Candidatus Limnocylindria bacterium]|nr:hypothetical protein [Candidatus Limnocylindria bacterium]
MRIHPAKTWPALAASLILPALALSLAAQQSDSLIIAGQPGSARIIHVEGRNYVEVEGLARLTNGSISFNGNQIVLTMQGATASTPTAPPPPAGFSKDFVTAGIEAMSQIREWHAALKQAIEGGSPLTQVGLGGWRAQAQQALRLASVAVSTTSDKNVLPFLTNEFNNMSKLSDNYLQMAKSMTYIDPSSLSTDPLDQRIRTCARSLASMATANQFVDDGSCQ